jgi:hypothetical protein
MKKISRYVIEGIYWKAGDNIYIDVQNDECGCTSVCLNDLIKNNIAENTNVTIVIDVEEKH